jgi:uncharacterized protein (TIGR02118 family)
MEEPGMIKLVMMVRRKSDLTVEQFRDHYERVHAPLALSILTPLRAYARSYPEKPLSGAAPDFDAITELWFEDEEALRATMAIAGSRAGNALREDEETFMDRAATTAMIVKECRSLIPTTSAAAEA